MLSMLLLLAAAPQSAQTPPPPPPRDAVRMPTLSDGAIACRARATTVGDLSVGNGLMWREGGEAVGLYRLLDRRVNGCPDPIVVNYRVPGSDALGREVGRGTEAAPAIVRRP